MTPGYKNTCGHSFLYTEGQCPSGLTCSTPFTVRETEAGKVEAAHSSYKVRRFNKD